MKRTALLGTAAAALGVFLLLAAGQFAAGTKIAAGNPLVGTALAHDWDDDWGSDWEEVGEKFEWSGTLRPGSKLVVETINGSVRAETGSGTKASVAGTRFARPKKGDWKDAHIEVDQDDDVVRIRVRFDETKKNHHENWVRVDFVVVVPPGVTFAPSTVNGAIRAEDMGGPVHANSVNGAIRVGGNGEISASAVNGAIRASVVGRNDDAPVELDTVNGTIDLYVPENVNADVSVSAVNGQISTDLPLTVQGKFGNKRVSGRLGKGGPRYELSTVNGNIRLLKPGA